MEWVQFENYAGIWKEKGEDRTRRKLRRIQLQFQHRPRTGRWKMPGSSPAPCEKRETFLPSALLPFRKYITEEHAS